MKIPEVAKLCKLIVENDVGICRGSRDRDAGSAVADRVSSRAD